MTNSCTGVFVSLCFNILAFTTFICSTNNMHGTAPNSTMCRETGKPGIWNLSQLIIYSRDLISRQETLFHRENKFKANVFSFAWARASVRFHLTFSLLSLRLLLCLCVAHQNPGSNMIPNEAMRVCFIFD